MWLVMGVCWSKPRQRLRLIPGGDQDVRNRGALRLFGSSSALVTFQFHGYYGKSVGKTAMNNRPITLKSALAHFFCGSRTSWSKNGTNQREFSCNLGFVNVFESLLQMGKPCHKFGPLVMLSKLLNDPFDCVLVLYHGAPCAVRLMWVWIKTYELPHFFGWTSMHLNSFGCVSSVSIGERSFSTGSKLLFSSIFMIRILPGVHLIIFIIQVKPNVHESSWNSYGC